MEELNLTTVERIGYAALQNASALEDALALRTETPEEADKRNRIICECLDTFAALGEAYRKTRGNANA